MSMMTESFAPWLRDINRLFTPDAAPAAFIAPGDIIITDARTPSDVEGTATETTPSDGSATEAEPAKSTA
jgi:hypothetical protein